MGSLIFGRNRRLGILGAVAKVPRTPRRALEDNSIDAVVDATGDCPIEAGRRSQSCRPARAYAGLHRQSEGAGPMMDAADIPMSDDVVDEIVRRFRADASVAVDQLAASLADQLRALLARATAGIAIGPDEGALDDLVTPGRIVSCSASRWPADARVSIYRLIFCLESAARSVSRGHIDW
jgi:hypothetical protein